MVKHTSSVYAGTIYPIVSHDPKLNQLFPDLTQVLAQIISGAYFPTHISRERKPMPVIHFASDNVYYMHVITFQI